MANPFLLSMFVPAYLFLTLAILLKGVKTIAVSQYKISCLIVR